jgi:hypothetical protein
MKSIWTFLSMLTTLWALASAPVTHAASIKIMAVGDSLTDNSPGYRGFLYEQLKEAGYDFVFVGPKKGSAPDGGPMDHAGHGGFTIGPGPSKADEWTNGKGNIYVNIESYLQSEPDIVLLLIGTNEFFNIGELQPKLDPNRDGPKRLAALVDRIHELKPQVKVLVGSVMPVAWDKNFVSGFNSALPKLLKGKPNTWFVDTSTLAGFEAADWSGDNLHPSESGYRKLAKVWFNALKEQLTPDPALKAAYGQSKAQNALAPRTRGQVIPIWNFTQQKPTYGYESWKTLDQSGTMTPDGWKVDALPDGGLGIVLSSPLDLSGATHFILNIRKDAGGDCDVFVKLICAEAGDRNFSISPSDVGNTFSELVLPLEKASGEGDLRVVKQIQIQGNFNKSQRFAYTVKNMEAETMGMP